MIEIAGEEERLKNQGVRQTIQAPQAVKAQPGVAQQFGNMAKQRAMEGALTAGEKALTAKATEAGLTGSGVMAGMGTAMPYVGAGILAGKALGFFNDGGHVGPLYAAEGDEAEDNGMLEAIARKLKSAKNYVIGEDRQGSDARSFLKGEGVQYNAMGGMMGPLASVKYKSEGGEIEYKYK